jgi:hypothetical protein
LLTSYISHCDVGSLRRKTAYEPEDRIAFRTEYDAAVAAFSPITAASAPKSIRLGTVFAGLAIGLVVGGAIASLENDYQSKERQRDQWQPRRRGDDST